MRFSLSARSVADCRTGRPAAWAVLLAVLLASAPRAAAQAGSAGAATPDSLARSDSLGAARPDSLRAVSANAASAPAELSRLAAAPLAVSLDSFATAGSAAAFLVLGRPGETLEGRADSARAVSPWRLAVVTGGVAGGAGAIYAWERARWWDGDLVPFHFDDHLDYAANMDKAAHVYATDVQALGATRALEWAGVQREHAALGGAVAAWLMQLQVEWHDAFYPQWGFDRYDVAANTLGAGWFYARERVPALRRFSVRWGYVPRTANPALWFNEDYQHHTYWVSGRVADLLPEPARALWPGALALSAGVAVADWDPADPYDTGHAELYLSVDLDYDALLPQRTLLGRTVADVLNRLHLPAPAVRLAPEPRFYLVFWGQ